MSSIYIEKETEQPLEIDYEPLIHQVIEKALIVEGCKHPVELNILLTDNEKIRCLNAEHRNKDVPTDVLSFPVIDYAQIGDIRTLDKHIPEYFNYETQELVLGDIVISVDKLKEQAHDYGHSLERELGFLIAHSMLHLFGYDHMEPEEEEVMKVKQEKILQEVGLFR